MTANAALNVTGVKNLATLPATTRRNPAAVGGKIGPPVDHITSDLKVTPLAPVSPEYAERYRLQSPRESFFTFTPGTPDIEEGDELVISGTTYRVAMVSVYDFPIAQYLELVVELPKGT